MVEIYASFWSNLRPDQSKQIASFFARNLREQEGKSWNWIRETYDSIPSEVNTAVKE
jgi:hypothetical protein